MYQQDDTGGRSDEVDKRISTYDTMSIARLPGRCPNSSRWWSRIAGGTLWFKEPLVNRLGAPM